MLTVRTSDRDKRRAVRNQQARDDRLRKERREDIQAHEMQGLQTKEAGFDRRAQAAGEFGLAQQGMAGQATMRAMQGRQAAETERARIRESGDTSRLATTQQGLGARQQAGIEAGRESAAQSDIYGTQQFHRDLGAKAYLGGQDPNVAQQLESSDRWTTNYADLKPIESPSALKSFAPKYSTGLDPQMLRPGGSFDPQTGKKTFDDDETTLKAMIKKLREEREGTQALGR